MGQLRHRPGRDDLATGRRLHALLVELHRTADVREQPSSRRQVAHAGQLAVAAHAVALGTLADHQRVLPVAERSVLLDRRHPGEDEIGRASCRERVCQYVKISVVAVTLKKKKQQDKLISTKYKTT